MTKIADERARADLAFVRALLPKAEAPGRVNASVPGPFSRLERALVYHYAKESFAGLGHLVELGSFLGASTQALAAGLKDNRIAPADRKMIEAYDLFRLVDNWDIGYQKQILPETERGDFLRRFFAHLEGFEDYVRVRPGDILKTKGPEDGRPIELLFVDLCKTEEILLHIVEHFWPKMKVGALYFQQDYLFDGLPFIKAFHETVWDYFDVEFVLAPTLAFRLRKPFDWGPQAFREFRALPRARKLELIRANSARFGDMFASFFRKSADMSDHPGWLREPALERAGR